MEVFSLHQDLFIQIALMIASMLGSYLLVRTLFRAIERWTGAPDVGTLGDEIIKALRKPVSLLVPLIALRLVEPVLAVSVEQREVLRGVHSVSLIVIVAWLLLRCTRLSEEFIKRKAGTPDNPNARSIQTQVHMLRNLVSFLIVGFAAASMLMMFDQVRQLGVSLLASAGVAGVILGFAAQRTIATLFAGVQIALTQPIKIDDVVIVENEWGRIEEITLTYVVVRIWDLRRLILPITYFIEKPFQNWTRTSSQILGTVTLQMDYAVPVERVRDELKRLLNGSELWDRQVVGLQVTEVHERTITIRALMSAQDAGKAWDLRCYVREKLIEFIRTQHPEGLPRGRHEVKNLGLTSGPLGAT